MTPTQLRIAPLLAGFVLAAAGAASAAAAPQYVVANGPAQATIVDYSTRRQNEAVLSFFATLLRRAPARLSDMDAYWGDGTLQVDCLGHQTRMMVTTGWNLDRTRRFDAPDAAYGAWYANADGSQARALENYVCHGVVSPGVSLVGDLGAFARAYLGGQAAAQAGQAPPAEAAPSAREAEAPAAAGGLTQYYLTDRDADYAELVDMSTRRRKGALASVTMYHLRFQPMHIAGVDYRWVRYAAEFDCARHLERWEIREFLSFEVQAKGEAPHPVFEKWVPILQAAIEPLVCDQQVKPGAVAAGDDLEALQRRLLGDAAGQ